MKIAVITIFPELVSALIESGIPRKARDLGRLELQLINPRDFTDDERRTVDDRPYGGGPGMVMKVEPLRRAISAARQACPNGKVIYLSPQGAAFQQQKAEEFAVEEQALILLAGRYEGIDERLIQAEVDAEISIGDYVLSGGELAAMVVIDAVARLLPGVLGHAESAAQDSFSDGLLDCPHYTRPEWLNGERVPQVLLSGNHAAIARWRRMQALGRTAKRRPDLMPESLNKDDLRLLAEYSESNDGIDD